MSEPKRYSDLQVWEALHFAGSTNGWVCWDDYVRIKANTDEVKLDLKNTNVLLKVENARLKAEVERMTKLFADTERLMLLDGEYEALKAGTYARLTAEVEYWKKGCER